MLYKNMSRIKRAQKGFTLIELLVVIAIIGVLASVVLASLNDARTAARDSARVQEVRQLQTALELYRNNNNNRYPCVPGGNPVNINTCVSTFPVSLNDPGLSVGGVFAGRRDAVVAALAPYIIIRPETAFTGGSIVYQTNAARDAYAMQVRYEGVDNHNGWCRINNGAPPTTLQSRNVGAPFGTVILNPC